MTRAQARADDGLECGLAVEAGAGGRGIVRSLSRDRAQVRWVATGITSSVPRSSLRVLGGAEHLFSPGDLVVYRPPHVNTSEGGEEGVVTSARGRWVFVRFGLVGDGAACSPFYVERVRR